jgi:hypothetical protein
MEFSYELSKEKALIIAKENIIYGWAFRKTLAKKGFMTSGILGLFGLIWILIFRDLFNKFAYPLILLFVIVIILSIAIYFKGEELQITALKNQTTKLFKKKSKLQRKVFIDKNQIKIIYEGKKIKSFSLDSILHITNRSDLGGIFFSKSKLARFVFFIDLSNLEEESKEEVFKILLDNLTDTDAQQELRNSLL